MTLAEQLQAMGLGSFQGVDRSQELAEMLSSAYGVTDFSQLKATQDANGGYSLTANGKPMQHMDRAGSGAKLVGNLQKNGTQFGYSAAGEDGTEYMITGVNPDGTPQIGLKSVSSNDGIHKLRDAALVAAAAAAGYYGPEMFGGAGAAGAGGATAGSSAIPFASIPEFAAAGSMGNAASVIGAIPSVASAGTAAATGLLGNISKLLPSSATDWLKLAGGIAGAVDGSKPKTTTSTVQRKLDPRIDAAVFGADGKSGLLGDMGNWYQQNKSGMNPQMQQASQMRKDLMNNPDLVRGLLNMGSYGMEMTKQPQAPNPFANWQFPGI